MSLARRFRALAPVLVLLVGVLVAGGRLKTALTTAGASPATRPVAPLLAAATLGDASEPPAGFDGPLRATDDVPSGATTRRTWFAFGRWWAVFAGGPVGAQHIWALSGHGGPWIDTGTRVDDRSFAQPWVVWTGTELVVATTGDRPYRSHGLRVNRLTWNRVSSTWVQAADFPVQVTDRGVPDSQTVVDGKGQIWSMHLEGSRLLAAHSDPTGLAFTEFAPLVAAGDSDIGAFSLTTVDGVATVAWRSVSKDRLTVATQRDTGGGWATAEHDVYGMRGTGSLEIAAAGPTQPGALVVLATTSLAQRSSNHQEPSVLLLLVRGRRVDASVVAVSSDRLESPRLSMDAGEGIVHVVAVLRASTPPAGAAPGADTVIEKTAPLTDLRFGGGPGRRVLHDQGSRSATPTVAPGVSTESGVLIVAADEGVPSWRTVLLGGVGSDAPPTVVTGGPLLHDTFDQLPVGGPGPRTWYAEREGLPPATIAADALGGRSLVLAPASRTGAGACRELPRTSGQVVTVRAAVAVNGLGASDARLLTVKSPAGSLASVRLTRKGTIGFAAPGGRVEQALFGPVGPLQVTIRIDSKTKQADLRVDRSDGTPVFSAPAQALLSDPGSGPDEICLSPAPGAGPGSLAVGDLTVSEG